MDIFTQEPVSKRPRKSKIVINNPPKLKSCISYDSEIEKKNHQIYRI